MSERTHYTVRATPGGEMTDLIHRANVAEWRLDRCTFAGYEEREQGNVATYELVFRKEKGRK